MDRAIYEKLTEIQVYLSIDPNELYLFDGYADPSAQPSEGFYTDFSGVKTRLSYFGMQPGSKDRAVGAIPFPDDGVHAEAIEYLSAIKAVNAADDSFTAVELGAGYGPWLTFSAKAAQKKGIKRIHLVAVEADFDRHALLRTHLSDNGLPVPDESGAGSLGGASITLVYGAISQTNGQTSFGSTNILDWGAAPIEGVGNIDFRGFEVETKTVKTYTIDHVIQNIPFVDFLHIDIQGFEYKSIKASIEAIKRKVRFMLVATHSRKIEGELINLLYGNGWRLLYEKPCKFTPNEAHSLEALTTVDGSQVWVNTDLVSSDKYEIDEMATRLKVAEYRSHELEKAVQTKDNQIIGLENEIAQLKMSSSWRITAPLRRLKSAISK